MKKRGQITIFLIVGILILVLASIILYFVNTSTIDNISTEDAKTSSFQWQKNSFVDQIENCLEETSQLGIGLLAINGGIIYPEEDSSILLTDNGMINYVYLNQMLGLDMNKMELDLAEFIELNVDHCLEDFTNFAKQNVIILPIFTEIEAKTNIHSSVVSVNLKLPFKITLPNENVLDIDTFKIMVHCNLGDMVKTAETIAELHHQGKINDYIYNYTYYPTILPYNEITTIYTITDTKKLLNDETPLALSFAVLEEKTSRYLPKLDYVSDFTLRVDDRLEYTLTAKDEDNQILTYSSDNSEFPVTVDGEINLIVTKKGKFEIKFTVEDEDGNKDSQDVTINVLEKRSSPAPIEDVPEPTEEDWEYDEQQALLLEEELGLMN
jgi:hypothetical protein